MSIYHSILNSGTKQVAILLDPDKSSFESAKKIVQIANECSVDFLFVGGSLVYNDVSSLVSLLKDHTTIPVIIFPGNWMYFCPNADGILFLSLISGRNPEYLIGQHVIAAPHLKKSNIEILPTGYILIESGKMTSVEYVSNTKPIPPEKTGIIIATAMAGEMLGLKLIYLEAGSGAMKSVDTGIIREVKKNISLPLIAGGGIRTAADARMIFDAGADMIVLGTVAEDDPDSLREICSLSRKKN